MLSSLDCAINGEAKTSATSAQAFSEKKRPRVECTQLRQRIGFIDSGERRIGIEWTVILHNGARKSQEYCAVADSISSIGGNDTRLTSTFETNVRIIFRDVWIGKRSICITKRSTWIWKWSVWIAKRSISVWNRSVWIRNQSVWIGKSSIRIAERSRWIGYWPVWITKSSVWIAKKSVWTGSRSISRGKPIVAQSIWIVPWSIWIAHQRQKKSEVGRQIFETSPARSRCS